MKHLYHTLITILLISSNLLGQQLDYQMYGFSFSETDFETADFFKMNPKNGQLQVISVAKGMGSFSKGVSIYDSWRSEYLIWAQNHKGVKRGYVFNPKKGNIIRTIDSDNPPVDLHYDGRQRKIYGLRYAPERKGIEMIVVNENSVKVISTLPNIKSFDTGNTTFDSNRGLYVFTARNADNEQHLYRINVQNGKILDQPLIDDYIFNELEYDLQDNKLYAIARKKSNISQFFFVEINILTAYPTIIAPIFGLHSVELGLSTFNHKEGGYIFVGEDRDKKTHLYELEVLSGGVVSKIELFEKLSELQLDNSDFIADFYKDVEIFDNNDLEADDYFSEKNAKVSILNSTNIKNNILFNSLEFIADKSVEVVIYDIYGKIVHRQSIFLNETKVNQQIQVDNLKPGIYTIKIKTTKNLYDQRFIKL
jgi:hypothetical protein